MILSVDIANVHPLAVAAAYYVVIITISCVCRSIRRRVWEQNIMVIKRLWRNQYPIEKPNEHGYVEKVLFTGFLLGRSLSLSNFVGVFHRHKTIRRALIETYTVFWPVVLYVTLFHFSVPKPIMAVLAAVRLIDIMSYQLCVLLVDSQKSNWKLFSIQRTFLLAFMNVLEIIAIFALLYLFVGCVTLANDPNGACLDRPIDVLYYSIVTMTTLGYGEFVPHKDTRIIVVVQLLIFVVYILSIFPMIVSSVATRLRRD